MRKLRASRRGPLRRAATMIEFTLVFPIFLFMMMFSIDMGMLMLTNGAMNDTAFSAARAGAQAGGAGFDTGRRQFLACSANGPCTTGVSYETAEEGVELMPVQGVWDYSGNDFRVVSGAVCRNSGPDEYVVVEMPFEVSFFTPGLAQMMGLVAGDGSAGGFEMTATGVARCELYRVG